MIGTGVEPWGSWANKAADLLGAWEWHGERDGDGAPCRWRMFYRCHEDECAFPETGQYLPSHREWQLDWSAQVDDECPNCGRTYTAHSIEDLLERDDFCPVNLEDEP